jgi:hypothetical protein
VFEEMRIRFLKRLFLLPRYTPAWFVRLEVCAGNSEIFFLKQVLKFWLRLLYKSKDSLIYKCYEASKLSNSKYSWYQQLKSLLSKWKIENILNLENKDLNHKQALTEIKHVLDKCERDAVSNDIEKMRESNFFSLYGGSKTHVLRESYLDEECIWPVKQLIMQLKLGISHLTFRGKVIRAKKIESMYDKSTNEVCELCGKEEEDAYHLMFVCPHYIEARNKYLHNYSTGLERYNYISVFNNMDKNNLLNVFHYFYTVFHIRKVYLEEMNQVSIET